MVTIDSISTVINASGEYGVIKLTGSVNLNEKQEIVNSSGTAFKLENEKENYIGNFYIENNVQITIDRKENMTDFLPVSEAVAVFLAEVSAEICKY